MTPIHLRENYLGIGMPEWANTIKLERHKVRNAIDERDGWKLSWVGKDGREDFRVYYNLSGTWEIVCLSKEVTESVAEEIVERPTGFITESYRNYERVGRSYHFSTPSLYSLLRSKGLDPDNTLILKKLS
jgi:hypothetical protein